MQALFLGYKGFIRALSSKLSLYSQIVNALESYMGRIVSSFKLSLSEFEKIIEGSDTDIYEAIVKRRKAWKISVN